MSTTKNEHNPDGLPEMEEFRFLCIGEEFRSGDEYWDRGAQRWLDSWNHKLTDHPTLSETDFTYRRRITPPADTTGSGREGETATPVMDACYDKHVHYSDQIALFAVLKQGKELERQRDAALSALREVDAALNTCKDHCYSDGSLHHQTYDSSKVGEAHIKVRTILRAAIDSAQRQEKP